MIVILVLDSVILMSYPVHGQPSEPGRANVGVNTLHIGKRPTGLAIDPNTDKVYVTNRDSNTVTVINSTTDKVVANVIVGKGPTGIGIESNTKRVYVANGLSGKVTVINSTTDKVVANLTVGLHPTGLAIDPNTKKVY